MKKLNNKGFILAETLVVAVFLMVIFGMLYANFYPLIGEYEKRENYDDVDGKYAAYWIKRMIESDAYQLEEGKGDYRLLNRLGYTRFSCLRITDKSQQDMCKALVKELGVSRCNSAGDLCDIYITRYTLSYGARSDSKPTPPNFKDQAKSNTSTTRVDELRQVYTSGNDVSKTSDSMQLCCGYEYSSRGYGSDTAITCKINNANEIQPGATVDYQDLYEHPVGVEDAQKTEVVKYCYGRLMRKAFLSPTKDYILSLPNYTIMHEATKAKYRIIVVLYHTRHIQHQSDSSENEEGYYSFSTMEVIK